MVDRLRFKKVYLTKSEWKSKIWFFLIVGSLLWAVFSSSWFVNVDNLILSGLYNSFRVLGCVLLGFSFGLAYSKKYFVEGLGS